MRPLALAATAALFLAPALARACGPDSDCLVEGGDYRVALPDGGSAAAALGAIVFLHGSDGSPEDIMGFAALRDVADRLGVALIVPRGINGAWQLPGAVPGPRDDVAFVDRVIDDAESRFPIDPDRIMVAGFSLGASLTWYVACADGDRYAGYAAVAGAFWAPYVDGCVTPLPPLFHVQGSADDVVPLQGLVMPEAIEVDTWQSFALLRDFSACEGALEPETPDDDGEDDGLDCSAQVCGGAAQEICVHSGGHSVEPRWIERAWRRLAAEKGWD